MSIKQGFLNITKQCNTCQRKMLSGRSTNSCRYCGAVGLTVVRTSVTLSWKRDKANIR